MEHFGFEYHLGRLVRKVVGEFQNSLVKSSFKRGVFGALEADSPDEHVALVEPHGDREVAFALLGD